NYYNAAYTLIRFEGDVNTKDEYRRRTLPVTSFEPNPWGLFHVHANVSHWVEDCYHDSYRRATSDGSAWLSGDCKERVTRGGAWGNLPQILRSARRGWSATENRTDYVGFRVARTLMP